MQEKYWNDRNEKDNAKGKAEDEMLDQLACYYDCIIEEFMMLPYINACIDAGKLDLISSKLDNKKVIDENIVDPDISLPPPFQPVITARKAAL